MGQNNLGYSYETGVGVQQDYAQALVLYRTAAAHGNAYAEEALGSLLKPDAGWRRTCPRH